MRSEKWLTLEQFKQACDNPKCAHCDKRATYFPQYTSDWLYCDECFEKHFMKTFTRQENAAILD